ncbi:hypothetical protein AMTRI_Chr13g86630 [Amborella trichopoda]
MYASSCMPSKYAQGPRFSWEEPTVWMLPFSFLSRCSQKPNLMPLTQPACPIHLSQISCFIPPVRLSLTLPSASTPLLNEQILAEHHPKLQMKSTHPSASPLYLSLSPSLPP